MIIKNYTRDGSLTIIDNVTDVAVPTAPSFGDYALDPWAVFEFEDAALTSEEKPSVITYAKDGPCALKVWGVAYICNDDGKTIETVRYFSPEVVAI